MLFDKGDKRINMKKTMKWTGNIYIIDSTIDSEDEFNMFFDYRSGDLSYDVFRIMMDDASGKIPGVQAAYLNETYKHMLYKQEMFNYLPRCQKILEYRKDILVEIDRIPVEWLKLRTDVRDEIIKDILFEGKTEGEITRDMSAREFERFVK